MNDQYLQNLSEIEQEFNQEVKGSGSLSPYAVSDPANFSKSRMNEREFYIGYDIHPENLEFLYFEGLKLPRWESIVAETTAQQMEIYQKSFQKSTSDYPLVSRVSDTDKKVGYTPGEVAELSKECRKILDETNNPNAVTALQKFYIACAKASEHQLGLLLIPN